MRRSKKAVLAGILVAVVLVGSIAGVVFAQTGTDGQSKMSTMLARVAEIYKEKTGVAIDSAKLQEAMTQAQSELRDKAMNDRLQQLVDAGKFTKEQAEQYKAWVKNKPDMSQYQQKLRDWQKTRPDTPADLKSWMDANPMPMQGPFGGGFGFKGRGGCPGCPPAATK